MSLDLFHPLIAGWFRERFGAPTPPQAAGWARIAGGDDTLVAAPTGSGKTLAAFLWSLNALVRRAEAGALADETVVVYVSPLKALGNDVHRNLVEPLAALCRRAEEGGARLPEIRVAVRSGDTPARDRARMLRRPPHILITTPESLYILLTARRSREMLHTARTVIVDEIHAIAGDKRGAHLALSLERLDLAAGVRCQRIGLSATVRPVEDIARLLVGAPGGRPGAGAHARSAASPPACAVVDAGHARPWDLAVEVPGPPRGPIATHETWEAVYDRLAAAARAHRTTLVFVNTRRLVERVAHHLSLRLGADRVAAHHGSLSRRIRLDAEQRLRSGRVSAVVATASLELGIDIGHVDLVCHVGAPRAVATLLQRVGRSGHGPGAVSRGVLLPLTRDDLLQCAAAVRAARAGVLDGVVAPDRPLDVLAQQIVAEVAAAEESSEEAAWEWVRRAHPYRDLTRREFDQVVEMLAEGAARRLGRTTALLHRDGVHRVLRPRRGARLAAITSGGAIPDTADYEVVLDSDGTVVGSVNEDFAVESTAGDTFLLGNTSWRIRRVEAGKVRVVDARGAPPSVPFWLGEAPARTPELSAAVSDLRGEIAGRRTAGRDAAAWLRAETGLDGEGAAQAVEYVAEIVAALGRVPTQNEVVAERFFDEAGGMQLVLHAPFGARINRAWGLALRKRFCLTFDFELQAAATDDGIVLSLGRQHSFPLESVFAFVRPGNAEDALVQALLATPIFGTRWRWNATRALALLRHRGGRRVPMPIQRMRADDLLGAVFPEQVGCQDNRSGPITPPDHPLVAETMRNCLHEAADLGGLRAVLRDLESGRIRGAAVETPQPSPASHELLHANPYAFLDDAPLEERRARAVALRRTDPDLARGAGALDAAAIADVASQAWPDARTADEVHDCLLTVGVLPAEAAASWPHPPGGERLAQMLIEAGRAVLVRWRGEQGADRTGYAAVERLGAVRAALPDARCEPEIGRSFVSGTLAEAHEGVRDTIASRPHAVASRPPVGSYDGTRETASAEPAQSAGTEETPGPSHSDAVRDIVHGWLQCCGPVTAAGLAARIGLRAGDVEQALAALEGAGTVLRGRFTPGAAGTARADPRSTASRTPWGDSERGLAAIEWCERRILARIHRLTLGKLRREIEPVPPATLMRFLLRWQHVQPGTQLHGRDGVAAIVSMLQGVEVPAPAWEEQVLPARVARYDPADLDALCLAGAVTWGRLTRDGAAADGHGENGHGTRGGAGRGEAGGSHAPGGRPRPRSHRGAGLSRAVPISFLLRDDLPVFLDRPAGPAASRTGALCAAAAEVAAFLSERGASFLSDMARGTGRLPSEVEAALWDLVAAGLVTGDGLAGLRGLLNRNPAGRRRHRRALSLAPGPAARHVPAGRWALWNTDAPPAGDEHRIEHAAGQLLRRYGVVFRDLLGRERWTPPWRLLRECYRRWEAQGRIRGGRFVAGFAGEQFALLEAVEALRGVRREPEEARPVVISAADPLNLIGILLPGERVPPASGAAIALRNGVPVDVAPRGALLARLARETAAVLPAR